MSEIPDPPDLESVHRAIEIMKRIAHEADFAAWTTQELISIAQAYRETTDPYEGLKPRYVEHFFGVRRYLKPLIRRLADEPKWAALANALAINLKTVRPVSSAHLECAMAAISRPWNYAATRPWERVSGYQPPWSADEVELIRAVIYTDHDRHRRFTSKERKTLQHATDGLGLVLNRFRRKAAWLLAWEALDLDVNQGPWIRATGLICRHVDQEEEFTCD